MDDKVKIHELKTDILRLIPKRHRLIRRRIAIHKYSIDELKIILKQCKKYEDLTNLLDSLVQSKKDKKTPLTIELQLKIAKLEHLNREMISDLINELSKIVNLNNNWVINFGGSFTIAELINDIQNFNPRGVKHKHLWLDVKKRINENNEEYN